MAELHRAAAIAGYGHLFPPETPPPTDDQLLAQWQHWLRPDWDLGRRAFVANEGSDVVGVVLAGPDPVEPTRSWYERLGWRLTGERKTVYAPARIDDLRYRICL